MLTGSTSGLFKCWGSLEGELRWKKKTNCKVLGSVSLVTVTLLKHFFWLSSSHKVMPAWWKSDGIFIEPFLMCKLDVKTALYMCNFLLNHTNNQLNFSSLVLQSWPEGRTAYINMTQRCGVGPAYGGARCGTGQSSFLPTASTGQCLSGLCPVALFQYCFWHLQMDSGTRRF